MSMPLPRAATAHVPDGTRIVSVERMSRAFTKYHLDDGRALHRFRMEEPHATPHDRPWSFDTEILDGGYVEEVFHLDLGGSWHNELVHRLPAETHHVDAAYIRRIVERPTGECWRLVRAGPHTRKTLFWRFGDSQRPGPRRSGTARAYRTGRHQRHRRTRLGRLRLYWLPPMPQPSTASHSGSLNCQKPNAALSFCPRLDVGRSFAWATHFRRLIKDYERYAETLAELHVVAFACLLKKQAVALATNP